MAKIELTSSELIELLNGEIETSELKKKLAKEMLRILTANEMTEVVLEMLDSKATLIKRDWEKRVVKDEIISLVKGLELQEILGAVDIKKIKNELKCFVIDEVRRQLSYENILTAISPELEKTFSVVIKKEFDKLADMVRTQKAGM